MESIENISKEDVEFCEVHKRQLDLHLKLIYDCNRLSNHDVSRIYLTRPQGGRPSTNSSVLKESASEYWGSWTIPVQDSENNSQVKGTVIHAMGASIITTLKDNTVWFNKKLYI